MLAIHPVKVSLESIDAVVSFDMSAARVSKVDLHARNFTFRKRTLNSIGNCKRRLSAREAPQTESEKRHFARSDGRTGLPCDFSATHVSYRTRKI